MNNGNTTAKVMTITPDLAKSWIEAYRNELQRPMRMQHVRYLAETMERGTFKSATPIELSRCGDEIVLTDGQHRLMAVQLSQKPQQFVVIVRDYDDLQGLAEDYTRTDKGKRRTIREDYKTLDLSDEFDIPQSIVDALGASTAFIRTGFRSVTYTGFHPEDRLAMMREYSGACASYYSAMEACSPLIRNRLLRAATMAVGLVTFRYSAEEYTFKTVHNFWYGVALDDGLAHRDPRKTAHEHLLVTRMQGGSDAAKGSLKATAGYSARYLANCFNAYVKGDQLLYTKVYDHRKDIVILGSPFNGK